MSLEPEARPVTDVGSGTGVQFSTGVGSGFSRTSTVFVVLARTANALFFLVTATYCILTYSSFAYQQFIRPRLVSSLAGFVAFHHLWHWLFLGITLLTLLPEWKASRGRALAWAYVATMVAAGVAMLYRPVLPSVENDSLGLWLACAFLLPPIWLAVYDHLATADRAAPVTADTLRVVIASSAAALVVWGANVATTPLRFADLGDYTTTTASLVFGAAVSLAVHVGIFTTAGVLLALLLAAVRRSVQAGAAQYWLIAAAACALTVVTMKSLVFRSLSFGGAAAWTVAIESAAAFTLTWSSLARRITAAQRERSRTAMEVWLSPVPGSGSVPGALAALAVALAGEFWLLRRVETFDWNFLVQNLCVLAGWLAAAALVHTLVRRRVMPGSGRPFALAALAVVAVAGVGAGGTIETRLPGSQQFVPGFVLDGYATVDPSYRLMRQLMAVEREGDREFFRYLGVNSLIQHVDVEPIDVDFVQPLTPAPARPPHIFLFVIDSLRRDYLSPYNPNVAFTPSFDQFARDGFAFQRSFTRYGGTGLSMPAIWSGSMLLHKEYVLPFQPMNALEKLLAVNRYQPVMSMDHITAQIVAPTFTVAELDKGRDELQYDFCRTLDELQGTLDAGLAARGPVFAHSRSLNLHISKLTGPNRIGAPDPSLGGFQVPAATAVRRMDACFGSFVAYLKRTNLYDDSIVIVTADHGDALGEARRWGHSYTLFPEIVRTPLLVHIPTRLRGQLTADVDAASYSTDITPSLYALLGYRMEATSWPLGRSLFVPPGTDTSWRRREPALVASSYGPVYGVLRDNGEALYIADGVNARDYAYDLRGLKPVRVGVTAEMRRDSRSVIVDQVAALASLYRFTPAP
ncbi:MAG TPA: sulfatase-like hydrolase/transferase [Vicinamibacterales bacterium]|nr:sulfatase-like hydrolase/transferase [Vicinamibacterales bacterium]